MEAAKGLDPGGEEEDGEDPKAMGLCCCWCHREERKEAVLQGAELMRVENKLETLELLVCSICPFCEDFGATMIESTGSFRSSDNLAIFICHVIESFLLRSGGQRRRDGA